MDGTNIKIICTVLGTSDPGPIKQKCAQQNTKYVNNVCQILLLIIAVRRFQETTKRHFDITQDRQRTFNVTVGRVEVTPAAEEKR